MFVVYVILNPESRRYIGQTKDLYNRLAKHNAGDVFSTKNKGPWKLEYKKEFDTRSEAMKYEKYLKSMKGGKGLDKILRSKQTE